MRSRPRVARLALLVAHVVHIGVLSSVVAQAPGEPKIVFSSGRAGAFVEICVMDPDGGRVRALTGLGGGAGSPRWAPDGRKIAFTWAHLGDRKTRNIYVMQADGAEATNLTDDVGTFNRSPTWSPNGRHIAYASSRPGDVRADIYVMDADGRNVRRLTPDPMFDDGGNGSPACSPDGSEIAFSSSRGPLTTEVFAVSPDGRRVRQITDDEMWNPSARWSPDGRELILESSPTAAPPQQTDIYVVDADGGNRTRLVEHPHRDQTPAWSPDGSQIVFGRFWVPVDSDVYVVDRDGGPARNLTRHPARDWGGDWFDPAALSVSSFGKRGVPWGWLKQMRATHVGR